MASKDRYTRNIECPKCHERGVLHISENDYPFMKHLDKNIDRVEGRFSAVIIGETRTEITCNCCGEVFP